MTMIECGNKIKSYLGIDGLEEVMIDEVGEIS